MQVDLNKRYKTRRGLEAVKLRLSADPSDFFPVKGYVVRVDVKPYAPVIRYSWTRCGRYAPVGEHELDLIEVVATEPDDLKINMGITFKVVPGFYSHTQQKLIAESLRVKIIDLINDDLLRLDREFDGIKSLASVNIEHERTLNA